MCVLFFVFVVFSSIFLQLFSCEIVTVLLLVSVASTIYHKMHQLKFLLIEIVQPRSNLRIFDALNTTVSCIKIIFNRVHFLNFCLFLFFCFLYYFIFYLVLTSEPSGRARGHQPYSSDWPGAKNHRYGYWLMILNHVLFSMSWSRDTGVRLDWAIYRVREGIHVCGVSCFRPTCVCDVAVWGKVGE